MTDALTSVDAVLVRRVRAAVGERLARERRDPAAATAGRVSEEIAAARFVSDELAAVNHERLAAGREPLSTGAALAINRDVLDAVFGLGRLERYLEEPSIENIEANGCDQVFLTHSDGTVERGAPLAESDEALVALLQTLARRGGEISERRFDASSPVLNIELTDGSRLCAVLGGPGQRGLSTRPLISIRRHRLPDLSLADLQRMGSCSSQVADFLAAAVKARRTTLVAGGTNVGKTTLLRALAHEIPPHERLVTIEKVQELHLDHFPDRHPNVAALEAREANVEGAGEVTVNDLVRVALRLNPSRVIVGEVLGDEVVSMLNAMSQGNDGSMCTIHANSSHGAFNRLAAYAVQAPEHLGVEATVQLISGAVDLVVYLSAWQDPGGPMRRRISSIREVAGSDGHQVLTNEVFAAGPDGIATPHAPLRPTTAAALVRFGYHHRLAR